MRIDISANGAPADVQQSIRTQIKRARTEHPALSATLASLSDDLQKGLGSTPGAVTVSATLQVSIDRPKAAPVADAPTPAAPAESSEPAAVASPTIKRP